MHGPLFARIEECRKVWLQQYPAGERMSYTERCGRSADVRPSDGSSSHEALPSLLRATIRLSLEADRWRVLVRAVGVSDADGAELSDVCGSIAADPAQCDSVQLRVVQGLAQPLFQYLLQNAESVAPEYAEQWRKHSYLYSSFVPLDVQASFERQLHCMQTYVWRVDDTACELNVISPTTTLHDEAAHDLCFRIFTMATLQNVSAWHCRNLRLTWLPSSQRKLVQSACAAENGPRGGGRGVCCRCHHSWNPFQINTGATFRKTCDTLVIWRKEEAHKTFVHELMHALYFDFEDPTDMSEWAARHFAVEEGTEILFFEAYVETWATVLNVYLLAARQQQDSARVLEMLAGEQQFVLWQVAKILFNSGFDSFDAFFGVDRGRTLAAACLVPFRQSTSVVSYFMLRSAHLWDMDWFVRHFGHPRYADNGHRPSFDAWRDHLLEVFAAGDYATAVNERISVMQASEDAFLCDTMRMTLFEAW
jgi:hypothetical protein